MKHILKISIPWLRDKKTELNRKWGKKYSNNWIAHALIKRINQAANVPIIINDTIFSTLTC